MDKKTFFSLSLVLLIYSGSSQILSVSEVIQEQNQWCWAAASVCVLSYYGVSVSQCQVAEYTRTTATWHNFGSVNCCVNPNMGCNYWNYNWGYAGSIRDILIYFGGLDNLGVTSPFSLELIATELSENRLFIIRWGWTSGGGHFLVGHGLSGNNVHYMDPWYGEGLKVANYDWVVSSTNHTWTSTNRLNITTSVNEPEQIEGWRVFPNPVLNELLIKKPGNNMDVCFELTTIGGQVIKSGVFSSEKKQINTSYLSPGMYLIIINDEAQTTVQKVIKQ